MKKMTAAEKVLYYAEVARIRKEMNLPEDVPVVLFDATGKSADWIKETGTPEEMARHQAWLASQNREEGGA